MTRLTRRPLAFAVFLALVAPPTLAAAAEAMPADASDPVMLDRVVVVAQRRAEPLAQVVSSVSLIDRESFEARLAGDAADLVRYVPGLRMDVEPQRFGAQGVSIRGLGGNRVRVEVDGVPLPEAFAVGQFAAAGRDPGDIATIERIEVLRGPASTLYGSDALAGIVAITTRDPRSLLDAQGSDRHTGLRLGYDGRDAARHIAVRHAFATEAGVDGLLLASGRRAGTRGNRGDTPAEDANPAERRTRSVLAKLVGPAGATGEWRAVLEHQRSAADADVVSQRFAPGRFATTYRLLADDAQSRDRASLSLVDEGGIGGLDRLDALLYAQDSRTRQDTAQFRRPDRATPFESLRWRRFDIEQRDIGLDLLAHRDVDAAGTTHRLLAGLELERTRYRGLRDGVETNLRTGAVSTVVLGERFPVRDFPTSVGTRQALFVQDEFAVGRFTVLPGLRHDRYRLDARPDALFREDYPSTPVVDGREASTTGKLGLRFDTGGRGHAFAQYARGFRAPPFSDLNIGLSLALLNYEVRPNPALRPETSRGLELGWRWSGPRVHAAVSLFRNDYRDLIESRANLGIDPATGALVFQSVNRDRARIEGIEAELEWDLAMLSPRLDGLRLKAAAATARGRDLRRDQPIDSLDPETAVLGLDYLADDGRWGAELIATATRGKRDGDVSTAGLFLPPGHAVFDAYAWWQVHARLRLGVGITNLGDRRWWRWADVRGLPADVAAPGFYSQPGRSVALSVEATF